MYIKIISITILIFTLTIQIFAQFDGNTTKILSANNSGIGTCPINQRICEDLIMNTENGLNMINKKILNYFNRQQSGIIYGTGGNSDLKKVITSTIVSALEKRRIQEAVNLFNQFQDDSILEQIAKIVYQTADSNIVLNFLGRIRRPLGYHYLFNEIVKNNRLHKSELLLFAEDVKTQINFCKTGKCLEILFGIKEKLPDVIASIVFSKVVCIKTEAFDDYLYVDDQLEQNQQRRHKVYFKKLTNIVNDDNDLNRKWMFEPIEGGKFYQIKSVRYNEYLYPTDDTEIVDTKFRKLYTFSTPSITTDNISASAWNVFITGTNTINLITPYFNYEYVYPMLGTNIRERQIYTYVPGGCSSQCILSVVDC